MTNVLITSALPYINGIKHLGNLAGSLLPADIHARYRRQVGDEVLFICATDEHGTPAELGAAEAGEGIREFCDRNHAVQADIYRRLDLSFDHFGRSSSPQNHALTQHFFRKLEESGFIEERTLHQIYSATDGRFLPDRYVVGTCPHCGSGRARGDQCESCTKTLDPTDLVDPRSAISGSADLEIRPTRHLFLRQTALVEELEAWIATRSDWPHLVTSIARKWLDEGIQDRCITRDLEWGVPVPKPGYEGKVFYVWFDAPIAYIAATQEWADIDPTTRDWRTWWWEADGVEYLQFLGKDNIPFHVVSFPCTVIGSGEPWKRVDVIKGVNWLTFEGGKFSTSERRGVFLDHALDLLPADYWRWWLASNAPESDDTDFTFERFAQDVNSDLADNFGNFVNRTLSFLGSRFDGIVPSGGEYSEPERKLAESIESHLATLRKHHNDCSFRKAAAEVRAIWKLANVYLVEQAPWASLKNDRERCEASLRAAVNLIGVCAVAAWPFIPAAAERVLRAIGFKDAVPLLPETGEDALRLVGGGHSVGVPPLLFQKLSPEWTEEQRERFGGGPV